MRVRPIALAALTICLCLCATAFAAGTTTSGPARGLATSTAASAATAPAAAASHKGSSARKSARARRRSQARARARRRAHRAAVCHRRGGRLARRHHEVVCVKRRRHALTRSRSGRQGFNQTQRPRAHGGSGGNGGHRARSRSGGSAGGDTPAPDPGGTCADAELMPREGDLERVRTATLCLVNRERQRHGEPLLHVDGDIQQAAQRHTQDMAFGGYFDHVGPHGDTPVSRLHASGYIYSSRVGYAVGENIAWGTLSLATPRAIVASWMASPEHRANILDRRYHDSAIGVSPHPPAAQANGQAGAIYTQDFGVIITG